MVHDVGISWIVETELLKLQKNRQFPDDPPKIEVAQIHGGHPRTTEVSGIFTTTGRFEFYFTTV
jgi:hypothetical protein